MSDDKRRDEDEQSRVPEPDPDLNPTVSEEVEDSEQGFVARQRRRRSRKSQGRKPRKQH